MSETRISGSIAALLIVVTFFAPGMLALVFTNYRTENQLAHELVNAFGCTENIRSWWYSGAIAILFVTLLHVGTSDVHTRRKNVDADSASDGRHTTSENKEVLSNTSGACQETHGFDTEKCLNALWEKAYQLQMGESAKGPTTTGVNIEPVIEYLYEAQRLLDLRNAQKQGTQPTKAYEAAARKNLLLASRWYQVVQETRRSWWKMFGMLAATLQFAYLTAITIAAVIYYGEVSMMTPRPMPFAWIESAIVHISRFVWVSIDTVEKLGIPFYVIVWGFLGGVTFCLYSAAYFVSRRTFDWHYAAWYLFHPFISALLATAISMLVLAGFTGIADIPKDVNALSPTLAFTLSLLSFVTGYSTKYIWNRLDYAVRKLLAYDKQPQAVPEETQLPSKEATTARCS